MSTIIALIALYILNVVDYVQTMYAINTLGLGFELNPIGRFLIENNMVFGAKMILVPILLVIMGYLLLQEKCLAWITYIPLTIYLIVVIRNFIVMFNLGILNF